MVEPLNSKLRHAFNPRKTIFMGVLAIVLGLGGAGVWSVSAKLSMGAAAAGQVIVASKNRTIDHLEGGIVAELLVRDGDMVEQNEPIIRLDNTRAMATAQIISNQYQNARLMLARLEAERDNKFVFNPSVEMFQENVLDGGIDKLAEQIVSQKDIFDARRSQMQGQTAILSQRVEQLQDHVDGLLGQEKASKKQISIIARELTDLRKLEQKGYAKRSSVLALEREASRLQGENARLTSEISGARVQIGEAELQILQLREDQQSEVIAEIETVTSDIFDLKERLKASKDILERTVIKAPVAGIVANMTVSTKGGVITAGKPLLEIVPQGEKLIVQAQIMPLDIEFIHKGMQAEIRFPSFDMTKTPTIFGVVQRVAPDAIADPNLGQRYYLAEISVSDSELAKLGDDLTIRPGMPAETLIVAGERTMLDYLLSPLERVTRNAFREM